MGGGVVCLDLEGAGEADVAVVVVLAVRLGGEEAEVGIGEAIEAALGAAVDEILAGGVEGLFLDDGGEGAVAEGEDSGLGEAEPESEMADVGGEPLVEGEGLGLRAGEAVFDAPVVAVGLAVDGGLALEVELEGGMGRGAERDG